MGSHKEFDGGRAFDWGRASADYAKYRDIYPPEFWQRVLDAGLCRNGQDVLDIGTGTGVLPRSLYRYGAAFTGIDPVEQQIAEARRLSAEAGMNIAFQVASAEEAGFPDGSFDVLTACQCFFYFDHSRAAPNFARMLRPGGYFVILYMGWLPEEDPVAGASEELILQYNPHWTGGGKRREENEIPQAMKDCFIIRESCLFDLWVPFTRESWGGRMKACRGIGASLPEAEVAAFEAQHRALLEKITPETFRVLHYAAMTILQIRD